MSGPTSEIGEIEAVGDGDGARGREEASWKAPRGEWGLWPDVLGRQ